MGCSLKSGPRRLQSHAATMADDSRCNVAQNPDCVVWTDDTHCLYLSFLEETFVNDLYQRQFCSDDICGCTPPYPTSFAVTPAESPSTLQSQVPSPSIIQSQHSKRNSRRKTNPLLESVQQWPLGGAYKNLYKRKRKCFLLAENLDDQHGIHEPSKVPDIDRVSFLEQPGNSSNPFDCERTVPPPTKARRSCTKRLKSKQVKGEMCLYAETETDQVVPSVGKGVRWQD